MQTANGFSISQATILTTIKPEIPKLQGNLGELAAKYKQEIMLCYLKVL